MFSLVYKIRRSSVILFPQGAYNTLRTNPLYIQGKIFPTSYHEIKSRYPKRKWRQ